MPSYRVAVKRAQRRLIAFAGMLVLVTMTAFGQAATQPAAAAQRPVLPEDEVVAKMRAARSDPPQYVDLIIRLVKEFPESRYTESAGFNFASTLKRLAQKENDLAKMRELAERFIAGIAAAPPQLRVRISSYAIRSMLDNNLAQPASALAQQTVALLNEKEYITFTRIRHERDNESALKANPNYKPRAFVESDAIERFHAEEAVYYSLLGNAHLKLDELKQAEAAFAKAYEIGKDAPAAAGLATILEKRGKDAEALDHMTRAVLTGRLDKAGLDRFHALYRRTHNGKLDGVEDYLDEVYRRGYSNPVKGRKAPHRTAPAGKTALAEFFTGAGCIPCIPFDYSFEAALEEYSRRDLVLLVYHWHAPTLDPMGNRSTDSRLKYYDVTSAPTIFLDGERFSLEGGGDTRLKSQAVKRSGEVYSAVTAAINKKIETQAPVGIKLHAERTGMTVKVRALVQVAMPTEDVSLHFALVENEIHYSGENGLRFHPMVVRSLARSAGVATGDYGFKVGILKGVGGFEHTFDLASIAAENLRYYDEWPVERNKEVNGRIGGEADFDVGRFKEQRHLIDASKLSVAVFLQDDKTKRILNASIIAVK